MKKRSTWIKITALTLAFSGALGYLLYSGMRGSMVYYLTLEDLSSSPPELGDGVRIAGWVKKGSIFGTALDGEISFTIMDGMKELPVKYSGRIPDTFEDGAEVVIEGIYKGQSVFEASVMLAKCPSKYEATGTVVSEKQGP